MSYTPSNAAKEIVKQIATSLDSAGYSNLLNAVNASPPTGFDINTAYAPVDGWLRAAVEGQATTLNLGSQTILGDGGWHTITSSAWTVTPYCPRNMVLICSLSGLLDVADVFQARVRYDGHVIAGATFGSQTVTNAFPSLMGMIQSSWIPYPLASKVIDVQVNPNGGENFICGSGCVASYAIF